MVFRDEKELLELLEEFKDQGSVEANFAQLEMVIIRIEEYLQEKVLVGEPSFDTEGPQIQQANNEVDGSLRRG